MAGQPQFSHEALVRAVVRSTGSAPETPDAYICKSLGKVAAASATAGLWRIASTNARQPWSVILKVVHHSTVGHRHWLSSSEVADPMYWKREVLAYSSGLLDSFSGGLRGARLLELSEDGEHSVQLWLEDVQGSPGPAWNREQYALCARQFGRAQGEFLTGRELPGDAWLSRHWLRGYVERRRADLEQPLPDIAWRHPLVRKAFPDPLDHETRALWDSRERTLAALDRLPRVVCHLDVWPRNLFSVRSEAGQIETVAIDWAYVGLGALGEDMGNLVPDSMLDLFVDATSDARELHETIVSEYGLGLSEAGWRGDPDLVRFGIQASAALKYVWMIPRLLALAIDRESLKAQEEEFGESAEKIYAKRGAVMRLLVELGMRADDLRQKLDL